MANNLMFSEENRLKSFQEKGWPLTFVKPEALAKCGFFYFGDSDRVKCPFCSIVIFNWQVGDNPITEHIIHSQLCPFINGRDVGNIFLGTDPRVIYSLGESQDLCGFGFKHFSDSKENEKKSEGPGVEFKPPISIELVTYGSRLATFGDWPVSELVSPAKLAESGFYYNGPVTDYRGIEYQDFVICFHCGVSLCQWTKDDDPLVEHEKYNPKCIYLYLVNRQEKNGEHESKESASPEQSTPELSPTPISPVDSSNSSTSEPSIDSTPSLSVDPSTDLIASPSLESPPEPTIAPQSEPLSELPSDSPLETLESRLESQVEQQPEPSTDLTSTTESPQSEPSKDPVTEPATESVSESPSESSVEPPSETELPLEQTTEANSPPESTTKTETELPTDLPAEASKDQSSQPLTVSNPKSIEKSSSSTEPEPQSQSPGQSPLSYGHPFIPFSWLPKPKTDELCCKVCLDFQITATFDPCLHTSCSVCAASLSSCPICRTKIERVIRLDSELSNSKISFYL